ncbi:hypothetical protein DUNSADRAFT_8663 [Dunaliella salina]|uniref:Uncharacterized protein n=1 Tax=Dunaliella salina TaxID=3046 RepID=A0ABQ7GJ45_DUNSA|nr:hypothetical protein DUNSADRAFT_8663 [Dunaliella salina]|eukprot:KAF5834622.1 hypothetical protein DUNSADRAFT_8663 [Dunaliella salina]
MPCLVVVLDLKKYSVFPTHLRLKRGESLEFRSAHSSPVIKPYLEVIDLNTKQVVFTADSLKQDAPTRDNQRGSASSTLGGSRRERRVSFNEHALLQEYLSGRDRDFGESLPERPSETNSAISESSRGRRGSRSRRSSGSRGHTDVEDGGQFQGMDEEAIQHASLAAAAAAAAMPQLTKLALEHKQRRASASDSSGNGSMTPSQLESSFAAGHFRTYTGDHSCGSQSGSKRASEPNVHLGSSNNLCMLTLSLSATASRQGFHTDAATQPPRSVDCLSATPYMSPSQTDPMADSQLLHGRASEGGHPPFKSQPSAAGLPITCAASHLQHNPKSHPSPQTVHPGLTGPPTEHQQQHGPPLQSSHHHQTLSPPPISRASADAYGPGADGCPQNPGFVVHGNTTSDSNISTDASESHQNSGGMYGALTRPHRSSTTSAWGREVTAAAQQQQQQHHHPSPYAHPHYPHYSQTPNSHPGRYLNHPTSTAQTHSPLNSGSNISSRPDSPPPPPPPPLRPMNQSRPNSTVGPVPHQHQASHGAAPPSAHLLPPQSAFAAQYQPSPSPFAMSPRASYDSSCRMSPPPGGRPLNSPRMHFLLPLVLLLLLLQLYVPAASSALLARRLFCAFSVSCLLTSHLPRRNMFHGVIILHPPELSAVPLLPLCSTFHSVVSSRRGSQSVHISPGNSMVLAEGTPAVVQAQDTVVPVLPGMRFAPQHTPQPHQLHPHQHQQPHAGLQETEAPPSVNSGSMLSPGAPYRVSHTGPPSSGSNSLASSSGYRSTANAGGTPGPAYSSGQPPQLPPPPPPPPPPHAQGGVPVGGRHSNHYGSSDGRSPGIQRTSQSGATAPSSSTSIAYGVPIAPPASSAYHHSLEGPTRRVSSGPGTLRPPPMPPPPPQPAIGTPYAVPAAPAVAVPATQSAPNAQLQQQQQQQQVAGNRAGAAPEASDNRHSHALASPAPHHTPPSCTPEGQARQGASATPQQSGALRSSGGGTVHQQPGMLGSSGGSTAHQQPGMLASSGASAAHQQPGVLASSGGGPSASTSAHAQGLPAPAPAPTPSVRSSHVAVRAGAAAPSPVPAPAAAAPRVALASPAGGSGGPLAVVGGPGDGSGSRSHTVQPNTAARPPSTATLPRTPCQICNKPYIAALNAKRCAAQHEGVNRVLAKGVPFTDAWAERCKEYGWAELREWWQASPVERSREVFGLLAAVLSGKHALHAEPSPDTVLKVVQVGLCEFRELNPDAVMKGVQATEGTAFGLPYGVERSVSLGNKPLSPAANLHVPSCGEACLAYLIELWAGQLMDDHRQQQRVFLEERLTEEAWSGQAMELLLSFDMYKGNSR